MRSLDPGPLILAARGGDARALDQLLARSRTDARAYARRHCRVSLIDDAVQETLLIVARKFERLRVAAALTAWIGTIVRRMCLRMERAMFAHQRLDEERFEAFVADRTDLALRHDLVAALDSLPAHYRRVILLRDFEELTIGEISDRLGEPPAAVKSRLHRARELMREYLMGSGYGDMRPRRESAKT